MGGKKAYLPVIVKESVYQITASSKNFISVDHICTML